MLMAGIMSSVGQGCVAFSNADNGPLFPIGVGKSGCAGLPSLQTVRAVFPHTAFQSVVACDGLIETKVGFAQTIQARFRKEVIRPAMSAR